MRGGALHQLVTSVLDLVGLLFLVAAAAVLVFTWTSLPGALAVGGAGLLAVSFLIDRRQGAKP